VTSEHRASGRRADDSGSRLRLELSGDVDWRPILRKALEIWVPDALRSRIDDIEDALVDLWDDPRAVVFELLRDDDGITARVSDPDPDRGSGTDQGVVRRWQLPRSR